MVDSHFYHLGFMRLTKTELPGLLIYQAITSNNNVYLYCERIGTESLVPLFDCEPDIYVGYSQIYLRITLRAKKDLKDLLTSVSSDFANEVLGREITRVPLKRGAYKTTEALDAAIANKSAQLHKNWTNLDPTYIQSLSNDLVVQFIYKINSRFNNGYVNEVSKYYQENYLPNLEDKCALEVLHEQLQSLLQEKTQLDMQYQANETKRIALYNEIQKLKDKNVRNVLKTLNIPQKMKDG